MAPLRICFSHGLLHLTDGNSSFSPISHLICPKVLLALFSEHLSSLQYHHPEPGHLGLLPGLLHRLLPGFLPCSHPCPKSLCAARSVIV